MTNKQVNKQICTVSDGVRVKEMGLVMGKGMEEFGIAGEGEPG